MLTKLPTRQADLIANTQANSSNDVKGRPWPKVARFLDELPSGSLVLDAGCGPLKHHVAKDSFTIGFDTCVEALLAGTQANADHMQYKDVVLADISHLPFRPGCADAALSVSVLHHIPSTQRRLGAMRSLSTTMCRGGRTLIYVWAYEQPNAHFAAQDVLVPWNLHELPKANGLPPLVAFHKNSTREQRIISNSIPIEVIDDNNDHNLSSDPLGVAAQWFDRFLSRMHRKLLLLEHQVLPPAIPQLFREKKVEGMTRLLSGIHRWSPTLSARLKSAIHSVEELYAGELAINLIEEAMAIALSTFREVVYYRYYHVFKRGELDSLIEKCGELELISSEYDSANWCVIAEKCNKQKYRRPTIRI
ncbi:methyltransferase domain-containing protein [Ditylenchus destructor]|nr:methyltransferase domain-containing protein [Ditylenchus destructor]